MNHKDIDNSVVGIPTDSSVYSIQTISEINNETLISSNPLNLLPSLTSNVTRTRERDEDLAKIEMALLSCIFIVTLMGNFIVILGIYFRRQKMSRMYYFILHLSLADLITAFFNVGAQFIMELTFPEFLGDNILCKFVKFTQILGPYSSSYVLVMTALDRYQAICYPLSNCTWTAKRSKFMLGIAWTISFIFCIPQLFIFSLQNVLGYPDCWASFPPGAQEVYVTWYAISFFIIPLIILIFAYSCICRTIWMNFNMKTAATKLDTGNTNQISQRSEFQYRNDTEDDGVFQTNRNHSHQEKNGGSQIMGLNRLNSNKEVGKHLEVSWRIDKKGNVNTITGQSTVDSRGKQSWRKVSKVKGERDSFSSSSPEKNLSDDFQDELLSENSNDIRIIENGNRGYNVEFHQNHSSKKLKKLDLMSKLEIRYKWSMKKNKKSIEEEQGIQKQLDHPNGDVSTKLLDTFTTRHDSIGTQSTKPHVLRTMSSNISRKYSTKQRAMIDTQPRTSSIKGISRAKIKTVKLTVTVILCYIFCSSPFITAQLWVTFDPNAYQSKFYTGTTFTILTLLASLNSCVNPWIFLFFNPNLLQDFLRGIGCMMKSQTTKFQRNQSRGSPVTQKTSPGQLRSSASSFNYSVKGNLINTNTHHVQRQMSSSPATVTLSGLSDSPMSLGRRLLSSSTNSNSFSSGGRHEAVTMSGG